MDETKYYLDKDQKIYTDDHCRYIYFKGKPGVSIDLLKRDNNNIKIFRILFFARGLEVRYSVINRLFGY